MSLRYGRIMLAGSLLLALAPAAAVAARGGSIQCTSGFETSGSGTTANWPTYHFMNNVTRNASGALLLEPLNDANAIAEYKGERPPRTDHSLPQQRQQSQPQSLLAMPDRPVRRWQGYTT